MFLEKNHILFHEVTLKNENLDISQEHKIDEPQSGSWLGFTMFTIVNEKLPKGFLWTGERLTKIQATIRPDHLWQKFGWACQKQFNER